MRHTKHRPNASRLIDAYIGKARPFAQPICRKIRRIILKTHPGIIEDWKWGPNYYKDGMVCGFGAFTHHVHLAFFRGDAMKDPKKLFVHGEKNRHNRGIKFTNVNQVNEKALISYVREAVRINERGVPLKSKRLTLPRDFKRLLEKNKKATEFFERSSYTSRKEYVNWITSAKKSETRAQRVTKAVSMLSRRQKFS